MFDAQVAGAEVREPIFVLGHWRSGTTLLHNLLVTDPQFAFPNAFETSNPLTFLRLERSWRANLAKPPRDGLRTTSNMGCSAPAKMNSAPARCLCARPSWVGTFRAARHITTAT